MLQTEFNAASALLANADPPVALASVNLCAHTRMLGTARTRW